MGKFFVVVVQRVNGKGKPVSCAVCLPENDFKNRVEIIDEAIKLAKEMDNKSGIKYKPDSYETNLDEKYSSLT